MITISEYLKTHPISKATLYNYIRDGKVLSVKKGRTTFILNQNPDHLDDPTGKLKESVITIKKLQWDRQILKAFLELRQNPSSNIRTQTVNDILADVMHFKAQGVKVVGYDRRSLFRKIAAGKTDRKTRDDKNIYRNSILKSVSQLKKLLMISAAVYFKNSQSNISLTADLVQQYARTDEDFMELAAIPRPTLIRTLTKEFYSLGFKEKHDYLNHYNRFKKDKVHVTGSFTDDTEFMDYIIGDDHKLDIDGVLLWNEKRGIYEKEKVQGWFWIEGKTQKILSYTLKTGDMNSEDLILSLIKALKTAGKPRKAILIDNGVGRSARFQDFCLKSGLVLKFAKPYTPTDKSTVERCFLYFKNEFDTFFDNFVGSNHATEGRHTGNELSPEPTTITFDEYQKHFSIYVNGFYETRERKRVISKKSIRISTKDLFDAYWKNFEPVWLNDRVIRHAFMEGEVRRFNNKVSFTRQGVLYDYIPKDKALDPVLNGKKFDIYYLPDDMTAVEMYAREDIVNKLTGEVILEAGQFVATLYSIRDMKPADKIAAAQKLNKVAEKNMKTFAKSLVDKAIVKADAVISSTVNDTGKLIRVRKQIDAAALKALKTASPVEKIQNIVEEHVQVKKSAVVKPAEETSDVDTVDMSSLENITIDHD